uniref:Uncharacterized protein n=1 Tax=Entomoneis paludosa TaxID=265537 RepID=A0A7S2VFT4_9STRA|mmetsp:Transcript_16776/g.34645  ORF Transcript_16776/g.34645 Transcript_16776/m.34645 type:complete len:170 (+) Transcript_16776:149-658(+)
MIDTRNALARSISGLLFLVSGSSVHAFVQVHTSRTPNQYLKMASSDAAVSAAQPTPALELPEPLRSETVGTWAYDTMSRRVDAEILERTYQDNKDQFEEWPQVMKDFQKLRADLQDAANVKLHYPTKPEDDASAERKLEVEQWMEILKPHVDASETWLSSPWMVSGVQV